MIGIPHRIEPGSGNSIEEFRKKKERSNPMKQLPKKLDDLRMALEDKPTVLVLKETINDLIATVAELQAMVVDQKGLLTAQIDDFHAFVKETTSTQKFQRHLLNNDLEGAKQQLIDEALEGIEPMKQQERDFISPHIQRKIEEEKKTLN